MGLLINCNFNIRLTQAEGKEHFGCSTLRGVELENQGGLGTQLSHWEKRILGVSFS